jgi:putative oxidoreductase
MAFAVLSGIAEAAGGLLLALGLLVPLASAAIIGSMLSALLAVHLKSGFWAYDRGYEYMIVLAGVSAGLAFAGGGAWSLDALLGLGSLSGPIWGSAAVIVGLVTALPLELYRRRVVAADQRAEEVSPPTRRAA